MHWVIDRPDLAMLFLARAGAAILALPIIGSGTKVQSYRFALVVMLMVLVLPQLLAHGAPPVADTPQFVLLMLREVLAGVFLGFAVTLAFLPARIGGMLIGQEMGLGMAQIVDPSSNTHTTLLGFFLEILTILLFLQWNGHHWMVMGIVESFQRIPLGQAHFGASPVLMLAHLFGDLFRGAIILIAPVFVILAIVSISMGLIARAVAGLNILEAGFILRIGGALLGMIAFFPVIGKGLVGIFDNCRETLFQALEVL